MAGHRLPVWGSESLLQIAATIEGHPDNVAPVSLVVVSVLSWGMLYKLLVIAIHLLNKCSHLMFAFYYAYSACSKPYVERYNGLHIKLILSN